MTHQMGFIIFCTGFVLGLIVGLRVNVSIRDAVSGVKNHRRRRGHRGEQVPPLPQEKPKRETR